MSYFHPRDFEENQPFLKNLSFKEIFMSYYGLKNSKIKFINLINHFNFISIKEANKKINWKKIETLNIKT